MMGYMAKFPRESIESALRFALTSAHSDFYRKRLGDLSSLLPLTRERWESLPGTPREEITPTTLWDRVHAAPKDLHYIRNTYGTSGKRILITPRVSYGDYTQPYKRLSVTRILNFFASAHYDFPQEHNGVIHLFGDVADLTAASHLAKRLRADGIYLAPFTAQVLGPMLRERGVADDIKMVQLCGERCSPLQFKLLRELYPNAAILSNYSSSETREAVAYPCEHDLAAGGSLIIEPVPEFYVEIIDPQSGKPVEEYGVYGELALTTLAPVPFPFIRYLTGDVAQWVKRDCGCDERNRAFEIMGRMSVFPVRLVKGELTVDAVEAALDAAGARAAYFEIHYTDEQAGERTLPRVTIALPQHLNDAKRQVLERAIERALKVYPTYTYAQGIAAGMYLPLRLSYVDEPVTTSGKGPTPIVVRHFSGDESLTRTGDAAAARV